MLGLTKIKILGPCTAIFRNTGFRTHDASVLCLFRTVWAFQKSRESYSPFSSLWRLWVGPGNSRLCRLWDARRVASYLADSLEHRRKKSQSAVLFIDLGCRLRRTRPLFSSAPRHIAFLERIRLYSENQLPSHMKGQLRRTIVLTSMT